ncbi:holo-ACP synthase [Bifidobacterium anseris]|uniref:Holo-[acyl-carrier-protein] synthase n=2 Tax=Bifidobacterium anseris TaxID=2020963 RepID=A0A2N5IY47_9BIFI|nr:holo-ACP synthase [Bifidobacterium anseris]
MTMLGVGHDVVDVRAFEEQLEVPGSHMRALFSARELRQARLRAEQKHDGQAVHLAGRWAAKESVIKAWCEALGTATSPYTLDDTPWAAIEVLSEADGCPRIVLGGDVESRLRKSVGAHVFSDAEPEPDLHWFVSISHDGGIASAVVMLCAQ